MKPRVTLFASLVFTVMASGLAAKQQSPTSMPGGYSSWKRDMPTQLGTISPEVYIRMDTVTSWLVVPGNPREVYRRVRQAYDALKLKVTLSDSIGGIMGNEGFKHTGALAGRRMSSWLSCGEGMAGPNADTWRITMAVLSSVEPSGKDSTKVRSIVIASAKNLAEGGKVPMSCATTGQMEHQIHQKVVTLPSPSGSE